MKWFKKLEERWQVSSWQVVIILIVFACTGFTIMFLKEPILDLIIAEEERTWVFSVLYYLLILPVYNVVLLIYGLLFGQFKFFWAFEKRMFRRMAGKKSEK
ncbi:prolipoprotein diacylglyceryl transferase [Fulvivirga sp. RKSG066]|uniref:DUF6787 family protein n=1 Tax=Fulvivirga aurantia TaxID=2529383 RepID=UPI0012BC2006|nr:DUF6787 family protein [Fulvivirga aurantia]MTI22811.1 prolipoprotein diacylglyceryl transferase [Fulvivirga aurantia]